MQLVLTGSGAKPLSEALGMSYIQEVVANSVALCEKYEKVGTAIELGGQDARSSSSVRMKITDSWKFMICG